MLSRERLSNNRSTKQESLESRENFTTFWLIPLQRFIAMNPFADFPEKMDKSFFRSLSFSSKISNKHWYPFITCIPSFLESLLGERFLTSQSPGYRDSMVYREPGRALQQSFHSWFVNKTLSLTTNRLLQSFQIWLNQISTAQFLSHAARSTSLVETRMLPLMIRKEVLTQLRSGKLTEVERQAMLPVVETVQQAVFPKRTAAAPIMRFEMLNEILNSPVSSSRIFVLPSQVGGAEVIRRSVSDAVPQNYPAWKMAEYIEFVYTRLPLSTGHETKMFTGASEIERDVALSSRSPGQQGPAAEHLIYWRWPAALRSIAQWLGEKQQADLGFQAVLPTSGEYTRGILFQKAQQSDRQVFSGEMLTPVINRAFVKSTAREQQALLAEEFTFLREAVEARPPQQRYAYAQPMQASAGQETVDKKTQQKEVVEIVSKEVETVMRQKSLVESLSRADLSRLTDHLYSSLARRLMIEKERMG